MKLHVSLLAKCIELPSSVITELRHVLDDLGLEVKDVEGEGASAVFNLETLANRGDHLFALGVARELSARYLSPIKHPSMVPAFQDLKPSLPVRRLTEACSRYALLEVELPKNMVIRPDVRAIMYAAGQSGVAGESNKPAIVDTLNFVQLELGQPMHAFDREKIDGEIIIELTQGKETIEALDGNSYQVPPGAIIIKDRKKIVAVAGVIGCSNSMVSSSTTRVLLESACFDPVHVRKTARAMGLSTDASYAFERGSDVEMVVPALRRVVFLAGGAGGAIKEEAGAHVIGLTIADAPQKERHKIPLSIKEIRNQMNLPRLSDVEIVTRLKHLGFLIEPGVAEGDQFAVVPSWRVWDIRNAEDIVEEVVRCFGLSRVKQELPPLAYEVPEAPALEQLVAKLEPLLLGQGFFEVMTRSYYSAEVAGYLEKVAGKRLPTHVRINNALEKGYSHLKVTNLVHLAELVEENQKHGVRGSRVFEIGRLFSPDFAEKDGYAFEREVISLACAGRWSDNEWRKPESLEQRVQLFRGVLDGLVGAVGQGVSVSESDEPLLHPGVQGSLKSGRSICGHFGLIHPELAALLGLKQPVLYAELEASVLGRVSGERSFELPSDFPSVKRDITLKIPLRDRVGRVERLISEAKLQNLFEVSVADDFRKEGEEFRRATFRLVFQSRERTLSHPEVDAGMEQLLASLKEKHQLELAV